MKSEFDSYINNYRQNCDNALWLSGESSDYFAQYKAQKIYQWFSKKISKGQKILDFGCGDGLMTFYISQLFKDSHVFGVDPSPESIKEAQKKYTYIHFSTNSETTTHLNFENATFDLIYSAGTFHHIPFVMHQGYIDELMRLLKPGGLLTIFELNPLNPLTIYTFRNNQIDKHAQMLTPWYAFNLAKNYKKSIQFVCFFPKPLKIFRHLEPFLSKLPLGALYALTLYKDV
jgi:ubiquinone/menaquinone biosynthesis C-methylase UbiE